MDYVGIWGLAKTEMLKPRKKPLSGRDSKHRRWWDIGKLAFTIIMARSTRIQVYHITTPTWTTATVQTVFLHEYGYTKPFRLSTMIHTEAQSCNLTVSVTYKWTWQCSWIINNQMHQTSRLAWRWFSWASHLELCTVAVLRVGML